MADEHADEVDEDEDRFEQALVGVSVLVMMTSMMGIGPVE
jgi:hypothetical protein